jgi:conjugal transfer pilus assembly protein TraB
MKTIKELYRNLRSSEKNRIVKIVIGLMLVFIVFSAYQFTKNKDKTIKTRVDVKKSVLKFDDRTFEETIYNKTRADVEGLRKEIEKLKKEIKNTLSEQNREAKKIDRYGFPDKNQRKNLSMAAALPLPVVDKFQPKKVPEPKKSLPLERSKRVERAKNMKKDPPIKQIAVFENLRVNKEELQANEDIKVHLPPSFMEANLLNGVTAPATDVGKNNPIPMLIRVNNLAVLPNNVKSNTKGCFVVAEGYGSLADERVHARLLSLSCINQKGGTVIDQPIKGFVVDTDGKEGMKGHVVAKFGQHIARVAIAGFLEGLGEAMTLGQQEFTYGVNTGVRSSQFKDTDADTLARAGIGQGIVNVAEDLQKFYLDLAEQSLPVIEVHPTKNITIVISEGVDIAIKKQETSKVELDG